MRCFVLIALFVITSCANPAKERAAAIKKVEQESGVDLRACRAKVYTNPAYANIFKLYPQENILQASVEQLNNKGKPNAEESELLLKMRDDLMPCRHLFLSKVQGQFPIMAEIYINEWSDNDNVTTKVARQELSWGEAVAKRQDIKTLTNQKLSAEARRI